MTKWGGNQVLNKMNAELFINTLLFTSESSFKAMTEKHKLLHIKYNNTVINK